MVIEGELIFLQSTGGCTALLECKHVYTYLKYRSLIRQTEWEEIFCAGTEKFCAARVPLSASCLPLAENF